LSAHLAWTVSESGPKTSTHGKSGEEGTDGSGKLDRVVELLYPSLGNLIIRVRREAKRKNPKSANENACRKRGGRDLKRPEKIIKGDERNALTDVGLPAATDGTAQKDEGVND